MSQPRHPLAALLYFRLFGVPCVSWSLDPDAQTQGFVLKN